MANNKACQRKDIAYTQQTQEQLMQLAGVTAENENTLKQQNWQLSEAQLQEKLAVVIGRVRFRMAV